MKVILFLALSALAIPKGFLLYEKAATAKDADPQTSWAVSAKTAARLTVNPCNKGALGQAGRAAAKTITFTRVPDAAKSEQVILYTSPQAAAQAMTDLRAALAACAVRKDYGSSSYRFSAKPLALGDEALTVTGQYYQGRKAAQGGERAVVARRGSALVIYSESGGLGRPRAGDFTRQKAAATTMVGKVCAIASCG